MIAYKQCMPSEQYFPRYSNKLKFSMSYIYIDTQYCSISAQYHTNTCCIRLFIVSNYPLYQIIYCIYLSSVSNYLLHLIISINLLYLFI